MDGVGNSLFVNANYGVTDRISLDLGYRWRHQTADDLSYTRYSLRLTALYRY